ncbi:hypothetical protein HG848_003680 [Salmonella enterica]|nr:hypothetical protein [Salmonella enterica]EGO6457200.1 hypothetical protein [Salmonella enterica]EHB0827294.1 hypothetical protein [Salmonella enterica]EIG0048572.1 DUF5444 family protein [Salmonella enterica]
MAVRISGVSSDAYTWAAGIALGWDKRQDEDWGKLHVA